MQKKIVSFLLVVVGASLGATFLPVAWEVFGLEKNALLNNGFTNGLIGALIFFLFSLAVAGSIAQFIQKIDKELSKISLQTLLIGSLGLIAGLLIGGLISFPLFMLGVPILSSAVPVVIIVSMAYLGFRVGTTRKEELVKLMNARKKTQVEIESAEEAAKNKVLERKAGENYHKYKILDTSVIIDGRVYDIAKTGFLEGTILIPNFVLYELQYIADSGDNLKRVRGRRGLDILNALQKEEGIDVEMYEGDFEDIQEVDSKLLKLAKLLDGMVVTNDFNLNKVAEFQNVPILNINALANAVKPVVIPGETMNVMVVKAGTERQQGVAYLDDGTMVVVEDGQHFMNQHIEVVVTSALQTAAGRMIFARPDHAGRGIKHEE
ncbi:MAG: PIN/TRAM domain-containing protein [Lactobacillales bacterium]|jgi:uncharacterized protein YacL|nr:PIN/TRAM domain-containing protein [Lactobacillales bacterium]